MIITIKSLRVLLWAKTPGIHNHKKPQIISAASQRIQKQNGRGTMLNWHSQEITNKKQLQYERKKIQKNLHTKMYKKTNKEQHSLAKTDQTEQLKLIENNKLIIN